MNSPTPSTNSNTSPSNTSHPSPIAATMHSKTARASSILLAALLLGSSASAFADAPSAEVPLTGAQIQVDENYAWVLLLSPQALPEPNVRFERGEVRAWFRGVDHERLSAQGDGLALRDVRIRSGAADTTLVHVRLGDRRQLGIDDLAVVPFEGGTALRFRRGALPMLPTGAEAAATAATDESANENAEEAVTATDGIDATNAAPANDGAETTTEPAIDADTATEEAGAPNLFETDTHGAIAGDPLARASSAPGTPVGLLLLITLFLGVLLVAVKFAMGRKKVTIAPDISVVSSKRIGPRHSLIVVRALGEEHLLSVNGGQTQLITSVSVEDGGVEPALTLPKLSLGSQSNMPLSKMGKAGRSFFPTSDSALAKKALADEVLNAGANSNNTPSEERFGARLLDIATRRTDSAQTSTSGSAVAGLIELRRRLG